MYEKYSDPNIENRNSKEVYLATELNLHSYLNVFKDLTIENRFRSNFKFEIKYDLIYDFYLKFRYLLNYDNEPVEGASKSDYVLQTTLGWEL